MENVSFIYIHLAWVVLQIFSVRTSSGMNVTEQADRFLAGRESQKS